MEKIRFHLFSFSFNDCTPANLLVHFGKLFLPFLSFYFHLLHFGHNISECLSVFSWQEMLAEAVPLIVVQLLLRSLHLRFSALLHLLPLVHVQQVLAANLVNSCICGEALLVAVVLCQANRPGKSPLSGKKTW